MRENQKEQIFVLTREFIPNSFSFSKIGAGSKRVLGVSV